MMSAKRVPIIDLVSQGQIDRVKEMINNKSDVNEQNIDNGDYAIIVAVERNDLAMVKLLIDAGARVAVENFFNHSPLSEAIKGKNVFIIKLIQETLKKEKNAGCEIVSEEIKSNLDFAP